MTKTLSLAAAALLALATLPTFAHAATKAKTQSASGEIVAVNAADSSVVIRETGKKEPKEVTFYTDAKTRVMLGGKKADLAQLQAGERASVTYTTADGKNMATRVSARAKKAAAATGSMKPAAMKPAAAPAAPSPAAK